MLNVAAALGAIDFPDDEARALMKPISDGLIAVEKADDMDRQAA